MQLDTSGTNKKFNTDDDFRKKKKEKQSEHDKKHRDEKNKKQSEYDKKHREEKKDYEKSRYDSLEEHRNKKMHIQISITKIMFRPIRTRYSILLRKISNLMTQAWIIFV